MLVKPPFGKSTVYVIGDAKTNSNNPITVQYNAYFIALVIDMNEEIIIDAAASSTVPLTIEFVKSMFMNYSMKQGLEPMLEEINMRYHGSSQSAMGVAWKDAYKKYQQIRKKWKIT